MLVGRGSIIAVQGAVTQICSLFSYKRLRTDQRSDVYSLVHATNNHRCSSFSEVGKDIHFFPEHLVITPMTRSVLMVITPVARAVARAVLRTGVFIIL